MRSYPERWRQRRTMARQNRAIMRALDAASTPMLEAELRALMSTQPNR
jgi:hypothetical protein